MNARVAWRTIVSLLPLVLLAFVAPESRSAEGDWCSSVVVRPDRRWQSTRPCVRAWNDSEVANRAGVVLLGSFKDVSTKEDRSSHPQCGGPFTHQTTAAYIASIRSLRPSGSSPILFVHMSRFELISPSHVQAKGFRASYLLKTKTTISRVADFFRLDRSPACRGACRWTETAQGLEQAIDSAGPGPTHEEVVYYVTLRNASTHRFAPLAAVADLTNPDYRQWRVQRAKSALREGGYDAVMLNQKFAQYFQKKGYWLGSSWCPNVSSCTGHPDTIFSAQPDGYGFANYVAGWVALAQDLQSANVPYVVRLTPHPWLTTSDDPSTPGTDEASQIRTVLQGAHLVLIDAGNTGPSLSITEWTEQLRRSGVRVLPVDKRCGFAKETPGR